MKYQYNPDNKQHAQALSRNMTSQERHLWYDFLKTYPIQFRRQKQFGNYIADFYCGKAKLVVELDGGQHFNNETEEYDHRRTEYMKSLGLEVVRYNNLEIDRSFSAVCEDIDRRVRENLIRHG